MWLFSHTIISMKRYRKTWPGSGVVSANKQSVIAMGLLTVTEKTLKPIIGPEMELSWKVVPPNNDTDCVARYSLFRV